MRHVIAVSAAPPGRHPEPPPPEWGSGNGNHVPDYHASGARGGVDRASLGPGAAVAEGAVG